MDHVPVWLAFTGTHVLDRCLATNTSMRRTNWWGLHTCSLLDMHANAINELMMQCNATSCEIWLRSARMQACVPVVYMSFSWVGSTDALPLEWLSPCMHVTCVARNVHEIYRDREALAPAPSTLTPPHVQIYTWSIQLPRTYCHICFEQTGGAGAPY
jgi:hypothetical protein